MSRRIPVLVLTIVAAAAVAAQAAEDPGMGKDLAATIALQGCPAKPKSWTQAHQWWTSRLHRDLPMAAAITSSWIQKWPLWS